MTKASPWGTLARLLTFRLNREGLLGMDARHLRLGLAWTWLVGMGRWWDDPEAGWLQHLGLGSVAYVFVLAFVLWGLVRLVRPEDWSYRRVLTFVSLTSPPGILYAIPVERLTDLSTAGQINLWFLALVALWRVLLLWRFMWVLPRIGGFLATVLTLLPLSAIVSTLVALNLHRVVFRLMGSIAEHERSAHDASYGALFFLTAIALYSLPVLLVAAAAGDVIRRRRTGRQQ